ncbi:MAG: hypothetical protein ACPLPR_02350 [Bacillota bacterium]
MLCSERVNELLYLLDLAATHNVRASTAEVVGTCIAYVRGGFRMRPEQDWRNYCLDYARQKRQRDAWRERGICTCCGANPAAPGHALCERCLTRLREYKQRLQRGAVR